MPLLDHWLGYGYGARISNDPERIASTMAILRDRFAADQELRAAAQVELARIEELAAMCGGPHMLHKRCAVSAAHRDTLLAVL